VDLHSYLYAVRQRWWLVLAVAMLAVGIGGAGTLAAQPKYASTVTFFVNTPYQNVTAAYQGSLFTEDRVKSYVDLLTSDRLAQSLATDSSLGLTAAQISGRITAVNEPNTVLLQVTVIDTVQARALKLTEALTKSFPALVQEIETPPGSDQSSVKVEAVDGPLLDPSPVSPRPTRNLALAALLGLLLGVGAAVLREQLDNTVRSDGALQQASGAAVLGQIPFDSNSASAPLIVGSANQSLRAEAVRKLRTNLRFIDIEQQHQVIALTSALSGEGKTTTCCNLAIALAETGAKVLLIDADLRRPRAAEYLGLEATVGLTDVLIGDVSVCAAFQRWSDRDLHVLASGSIPPNPSELLGSQRMADLLRKAREWADIVLIDTPPLLSVTDGAVVAAQADGTMLLSRYGKTTQPQVAAAARSLQRVSARLLGCVLTMTKTTRLDAYYYGDVYRTTSTEPAIVTPPRTGHHEDGDAGSQQDTQPESPHTLIER
jgi:capsular exopolysaccharide synthesis family protein